jgi:hypothetical protein
MNRPRRNRYRAGGLLLALVGLLAAVGALAGFAVAKNGSHRLEKRHHHGHHRHHHGGGTAGTIASFDPDTGRLTISLSSGDSVSGLVTNRTRIKCEDEHSPDITQLHSDEEESGDDHGDHGNEPNDDNGDHDDGDNSGPGSSHSDSGPSGHDDNGTGANCTTSDLIPGAVVEKADLELEHGRATFDEVELAN